MFFHAALACRRVPPFESVQDILVGLNGVGRVLRDVEGLAPEVFYMLFHLFADADQQLVAAELHDSGVELLVVDTDSRDIVAVDRGGKLSVDVFQLRHVLVGTSLDGQANGQRFNGHADLQKILGLHLVLGEPLHDVAQLDLGRSGGKRALARSQLHITGGFQYAERLPHGASSYTQLLTELFFHRQFVAHCDFAGKQIFL